MLARVLSGTVVAFVLSGAVSATMSTPEVLANPSDVLRVGRTLRACTGYCVSCAQAGHAADAAPTECDPSWCTPDAKVGSGWHTACTGETTCDDHACSGGASDDDAEALAMTMDALFSEVGNAIVGEDFDELHALLAANPRRLHVAANRQALQIVACDGDVIAHYPLSDVAAHALDD